LPTLQPTDPAALLELALAKVNLTLKVVGRRADGYHELVSLVVFAALADRLTLAPDDRLYLEVSGPNAQACGASDDNLVLKAARALAAEIRDLRLGRFALVKHLPVAAGIGGGSSDAAAGLRLLARANGLAADDARLFAAAGATGADVPVCLDPRPRIMRGVGERLSAALDLPPLPAVLVNPGVAVPTKDVFAALRLSPGGQAQPTVSEAELPSQREALIAYVAGHGNDLEPAAISLQPIIADVLALLREQRGCSLARMSGSGATCLGVFASRNAALAAARGIAAQQPHWWVRPTTLTPRPRSVAS
jgi:4-diphosphocytidyl-2-C-methyl-D-erythritol kinase